jgi:leucyl-tRNA synthetase
MEYRFAAAEARAREIWKSLDVYTVPAVSDKPKCYVLDMFPYPSGAGLHVGHPLGYIASDIYARYKRLKGFNVLHPMGFDAFGLPAEQYALETGRHPAVTTQLNIARYKEQLNKIGLSYDWSREVNTADPSYYKWTQWIFLQLFHSWYDKNLQKTRPIAELIAIFEKDGSAATVGGKNLEVFTGEEWKNFDEAKQRSILMRYRVAYQDYATVWWCEALGTVLANDEVVNGVSERGGHPAERRLMRQWFLRITDYADRLLTALDTLDWSDAMKEMQRNWIGKSTGASVKFKIDEKDGEIEVFTTRPDTIFGVDFVVLAPEHELTQQIATADAVDNIARYLQYVKSRSERERLSEVKSVTGCFTGAYAIHPFSGRKIPIWTSEYVLAGYGTGAIMGVPCGDDRDHAFAKHFGIPITNIFGACYTGDAAFTEKSSSIPLQNSCFLDGLTYADAMTAILKALAENGTGVPRVNYRLRDAGFSRQRYWGEPFPIIYVDNIPYAIDESKITNPDLKTLPLELPRVDSYRPGPDGQGPLANITDWVNVCPSGEGTTGTRETNTMPGFAGSSWYFLRYADPHNTAEFASRQATDYWNQADLYVGGTEHAVGHLLYARMWTKALYDLGHIGFDEPFKKLLNQGMIQGSSRFIFEVNFNNIASEREGRIFASQSHYGHLKKIELDKAAVINYLQQHDITKFSPQNLRPETTLSLHRHHVDVNLVDGVILNLEKFETAYSINADNRNILTEADGTFITDVEVEKMSKSKYNVINPDVPVEEYGADTFRMYEMFLGPVEMSKPWDTKGIEGVYRFLKKLWKLYADEQKGWLVTDETPNAAEWRILHKAIKKISEDIEKFAFNTCVSQFMITVNELQAADCHKKAILEPLAILICPFAPHIAEELWQNMGNAGSVVQATLPDFDEQYIKENSKNYPIAINGKPRLEMEFDLEATAHHVESTVLAHPIVQKWMEGKAPKKFIYVKGKMINIVV